MKNTVRVPQQERSIEKKNKIITAGYELFSEVGYYGTNTAEIAKRANVSTGIVYGYFQDKRDILICVLNIYIEKITAPILETLNSFNGAENLRVAAEKILDLTIRLHSENAKMHNALHSLAATDEAVNAAFISLEDSLTKQISEQLVIMGVNEKNITEKTHMAINIVQSFAHEYVFDKHGYIDYPVMKNIVCEILIKTFG